MKNLGLSILFLFGSFCAYSQTSLNYGLQVEEDMSVLFGDKNKSAAKKLIWNTDKGAFRAGWVDTTFQVGNVSIALGSRTKASGHNSTAMGDSTLAIGVSSTAMGYKTMASDYSTAMGDSTSAIGKSSTAIGRETIASGNNSTAMGYLTTASGNNSTAMGASTTASNQYSTAMGFQTTASGHNSFAIGRDAIASGTGSIAMGFQTKASGNSSTAIGARVNTNHHSSTFMIGDSDPQTEGETIAAKSDEMICRFYNGYFFMTSGDNVRMGMKAAHGANSWTSISDRTRKENFEPLNDLEVLKKIASVDYESWNYKGQDPKIFRHYGMMAQDFYRLFGKDQYGKIGCDTLINPIDMLGITMSAIKGAAKEIAQQEQEINTLREEITDLKELVTSLIPKNEEGEAAQLITLKQEAFLAQNQPNPFHQSTTIPYFLPQKVKSASLRITTQAGAIVKETPIHQTGNGQIILKTNALPAGIYYYSLIVDGQLLETKRMMLNWE